jgi:hypothetical protein
MRVVVEPRHKDYAIDAHSPLFLQHLFGFFPEDSGGSAFVSCCFPFPELLALWEGNSNKTDSNTQASGDPEDSLE